MLSFFTVNETIHGFLDFIRLIFRRPCPDPRADYEQDTILPARTSFSEGGEYISVDAWVAYRNDDPHRPKDADCRWIIISTTGKNPNRKQRLTKVTGSDVETVVYPE
jgi:hypothetical protein